MSIARYQNMAGMWLSCGCIVWKTLLVLSMAIHDIALWARFRLLGVQQVLHFCANNFFTRTDDRREIYEGQLAPLVR